MERSHSALSTGASGSDGRRTGVDDSYSAPSLPDWYAEMLQWEEEEKEVHAAATEQGRKNWEMPASVLAKKIRDGLRRNGTNVIQNDNDPMGDGDQSEIKGTAQRRYHRILSLTKGDMINCAHTVKTLSTFALAVLAGDLSMVESMLKMAEARKTGDCDDGMPSPSLVALLETRETCMRLSPLLMLVSFGKESDPSVRDVYVNVAVAKLLLKYGARPDAKDLLGKTVFHHGAGGDASDATVAIADLCLQAQEGGSHMFGKKVKLTGLSDKAMNGREGIALGFDVDSGRRYVSMPGGNGGDRRKVAVKPANLRLAEEETDGRPRIRLCDVQDRFGAVCFMDVILKDNLKAAVLLLARDARIDIADGKGSSPISMFMLPWWQQSNKVCSLSNDDVCSKARRDRRKLCSSCGKDEKVAANRMSLCAGCKVMRYCSRECQLQHWSASHKVECRVIQAKKDEQVVLERPPAGVTGDTFLAIRNELCMDSKTCNDGGSYRMPRDVQVGQKFTIRVQALGSRVSGSLLIYNETRDCSFFMGPGQAGFTELFDVVRAEKVTGGFKTYMKALFDEEGNCVAFPGDTSIHVW